MNYSESINYVLRETLQREADIIEAYRETIVNSFDEAVKKRALIIFDSYLSAWDDSRYIPTLEFIKNQLAEQEERAKKWREERERAEKAAGGES